MAPVKYFAFDTETSGLDPRTDCILSLAYILLDAELNVIATAQGFFFPPEGKEVSAEAAAVNGYSVDTWRARNALPASALAGYVSACWEQHGVARALPLGHNVKFDLDFLKEAVDKGALQRALSYHSVDTLTLSVAIDQAHHIDGGRYRLTDLCSRYGVVLENAHDSLGDISATVALYRRLLECIRGQDKTAAAPPQPTAKGRFLVRINDMWQFALGKHRGKSLDESSVDVGYLIWVLNNVTLTDEEKAAIRRACGQVLG